MVSRRGFLTGSALGAAGGVIGLAGGATGATMLAGARQETFAAERSVDFFGKHQMGIELEMQAVTNMVALDLKPETNREAMLRWMKLLTDDISRLSQGEPVLADPSPELMIGPARFSAYVGFGPSMFQKL
ncbi:MAG: Dyp-type peroxidase domain-containing protein, partial [Aquiluna sp.]